MDAGGGGVGGGVQANGSVWLPGWLSMWVVCACQTCLFTHASGCLGVPLTALRCVMCCAVAVPPRTRRLLPLSLAMPPARRVSL